MEGLKLISMKDTMNASERNRTLSFQQIQNNLKVNEKSKPLTTSLSISENVIYLLNSNGLDTRYLLPKDMLIRSFFLIPFVSKNTHLWIYGRPSLGKSFLYSKVLSPSSKTISGKPTSAQLFGNITKGESSLIASHIVICLEDIQNLTFDNELKGTFLDFLSTGEARTKIVSSSSATTYDTSFVFTGNFDDEIEEQLQNQPYQNIKELLNSSFPDGFNQQNFKTRVIPIPTWLCQDSVFIEDKDTKGYPIDNLLSNFEIIRNMDLNSLNINSFLKTDSKIPRIKDNLRKMTLGFYKLLNFSQLVLQDKPIIVPLDIEAISFIFEKILKLPFSDSKFTLVGNTAVNQFWIKFSSHLMKYPLSSITEAYVDEHRITVRFQEEPDKLFKIALDKIGLEYNKTEVSIYKEFANSIEYSDSLIPIFSINENYTSIIAKTPHSPFSNYLKVDNIKEILSENNHFDVTTICEENPNLIPCIKYLENKIEKIANENRELKESNKNLTKLFTEMFSKNERMAIAKAPLSKEEIENLIYIHIKELASISKLSQDTFKNYHFVYDYENRKTLLLDYYFLKQPNSDYYQNF